jgi:hypothetical protein
MLAKLQQKAPKPDTSNCHLLGCVKVLDGQLRVSVAAKTFADEDAQYAPCPAGMRPDVWRGIQRDYKGKLTIN